MGSIKEEIASQFRSLGVASTIAMAVVFSTFAGVYVGHLLDTRVFDGKTYPWLTIICLFFGLAGGVKNFFILSKRFSEEAEKAGEGKKKPEDTTEDDQDDPKHTEGQP